MKTIIVLFALATILKSGDAAITWTTPSGGTGTLTVSEAQALNAEIATYAATSDTTGASAVTLTLTTQAPFVLTNGALTITANLDADTTSSYTLEIVGVDNGDTPETATASITVTVTDIDDAPAFGQSSYTVCIADASAADTTLTTVLATDGDPGDTIVHAIANGNSAGDFAIVPATGVITVATGKTLDMATTATYTLVVTATDDEATPQIGTTTVSVEVNTDGVCSGAAAVTFSIMTILMTLVATM